MVKVEAVTAAIERMAPMAWKEDWDRVGLQLGSHSQEVRRVLVALDVTLDAVQYAIEQNVQLIVAHHPLFFKPLESLRWETSQGQIIKELVQHDMAVYAAHTNWDKACLNDELAKILTLSDVRPLQQGQGEPMLLYTVYVPVAHAALVREAIAGAGGGRSLLYDTTSFSILGTGRFRPLLGAKPHIGEVGAVAEVEEECISTLVPQSILSYVLTAVRRVHPYEVIAYTVQDLPMRADEGSLGRLGTLTRSMSLTQFTEIVRDKLDAPYARSFGPKDAFVRTIALIGGSGGSLWHLAQTAGADLFLTGEASHHQVLASLAAGLPILTAGHDKTEQVSLPRLVELIKQVSTGLEVLLYDGQWQ